MVVENSLNSQTSSDFNGDSEYFPSLPLEFFVLAFYLVILTFVKYFNPKFACFRIRARQLRCEWDGIRFGVNVNVRSSPENIGASPSSSSSLIGQFCYTLFSRLTNSRSGKRNVQVGRDSKKLKPIDYSNTSFYDNLEKGNISSIQLSTMNSKNNDMNENQDGHQLSSTSSVTSNKNKLPIEIQWRQFQLQQQNYRRRRQSYHYCFPGSTEGESSSLSKMINLFYSLGVYIFFFFQLLGILFLIANLMLTLTRSNLSPLFHPTSFGNTDQYGRGVYDIKNTLEIEDSLVNSNLNHRMLSSIARDNTIFPLDSIEKESTKVLFQNKLNLLRDFDSEEKPYIDSEIKNEQMRILNYVEDNDDQIKAEEQNLLDLNILDELDFSSPDRLNNEYFNENDVESINTSGTRYIVTTLKPLLPDENNLPGGWFLLWICVLIALIIHEFGHGFVAYLEGCPLKSFGVSLYGVIPGAYVQVDESVQFLSPFSQLKIYCAGVWHNFILAFMLYLLLSFTMSINNIPSLSTNHSSQKNLEPSRTGYKASIPTKNLRGPKGQSPPLRIQFPFMQDGDEVFSIQDIVNYSTISKVKDGLQPIPGNTFTDVINSIQETSSDRRNKFEDILNLAIDPEVDTAIMVNRWVLEDNVKAFQDFGLLQATDKFYPMNIVASPDSIEFMTIEDFKEEIASNRKSKSSLDCCNLQSLLSQDATTDSSAHGYGCFAITDNTKVRKEYLSCLPVSSTLSMYAALKDELLLSPTNSENGEISKRKQGGFGAEVKPHKESNQNILSTSLYLQPITIPPQTLMKVVIKRNQEYLMYPFQGNLLSENYLRDYSDQQKGNQDTDSTETYIFAFCIFLNMLIHVSLSIGAINLIPALQLDGAHASLQFLLLFYHNFSPKVQKEKTFKKDLNGGAMSSRSKILDSQNFASYGHPYIAINIDTMQQENALILQRIKRLNKVKKWHNWLVVLISFLLAINIIFALLSLIL